MQPSYDQIRQLWKLIPMKTEIDLDAALQHFKVLFAYHSGKMENADITFHDTRDIFDRGRISGYSGDPRALFEQQNQKLCHAWLLPKILTKEPLTVEIVLDMHRVLTAGTYDNRRFLERGERPGAFKKHDCVTGVHEVGEPPEQVPAAVDALLQEINEWTGDSSLLAAAYLHARFEYIHPFADGNGRVGRTLMNYWLLCQREPPLVIYEEDRKEYYLALEQYDANETLLPLVSFLERQTVRTWSGLLKRSNGESAGLGRKSLKVHTEKP